MILAPPVRKLALTAHVTSSVGWLGAICGFLVLAVVGALSSEDQAMRAAYIAMELLGWLVIVPLSFASPLTGVVSALGTAWGLFRHYWVTVKFLITIPCTLVLLAHMYPTGRLAAMARQAELANPELGGLRVQLIADAGAAVVVLVLATALSIYKPRGLIWQAAPRWVKVSGIGVATTVAVFLLAHLVGGGHP